MNLGKVWSDPVFSKVIAGGIIGLGGLVVTFIINYFNLPIDERHIFNIDIYGTVELNAIFVTTLLVSVFGYIIWSIALNRKKYDVFFSAPMSFETDEEYQATRADCMKLIEEIKKNTSFKRIYYAAEKIETMEAFSTANHAATDDLRALKKSKRFLLYMPRKIPSSSIFEAGYAFKRSIPTVYFCHSSSDLPFLLKDLNDSYRMVRKYEGKSVNALCRYVKQHKTRMFAKSI
ncbi:hypothetical protein VIBNISO65_830014 [Vibrio nigripulchritudo SO65]|uniref:hypothetical protein n=1 Tax=Vibrio nigripulchritudo TaxID=28173 RepID=UPI0003B2069D|nr:hypothetical protein [Vibrio nigripulchritudo]CCN38201.1 hypothetical protein VIBNIAM115_840013 [Vibrio nigripulchritudo AM115]CCN42680.1 hypothetical protein VIBNIFTn2_360014 [Vibrio nigripulchritudo FTn2]CCN79076.1 hypothetical protein VIBNISO65_830014 [Vibrio nigripulchritudo SO65]